MRARVVLAIISLVAVSSAARADSFGLYVAYADSLRASGFFPNPFCSGITPSCQVETGAPLDGGVFRIDNTGTTPLSVSDLKVTLDGGAQTFALWNPVTIAAGGSAVFGQTVTYNFDTSDFGFFSPIGIGINGIGGCTVYSDLTAAQQALCTANDPVITFLANGVAQSVIDSGSILNTGGYDFACCSSDLNESIGWHLAGDAVVQRQSVPEPLSAALFGAGLAVAPALRRRRIAAR